jgi:hypothetical protein
MKARRHGLPGGLVLLVGALIAPASSAAAGPSSIEASGFAVSPPARSLPAAADIGSPANVAPRLNPLAGEPNGGARGTRSRGAVPADPLADSSQAPGRTPAPLGVFDGVGAALACANCVPPDTTGDVGPNNYVQMVNSTKVAIFDKAGTSLAGPFNLSALFTPLGGPCATGDLGDPQVVYDSLADRWLLSQFTSSNQLCFAVSQTGNPLGAYFLYAFTTPNFPDYFKVGVWPTGYYVGTNEASYTAYAFDRAKMLAGDSSAIGIRVAGQTNFLMPADVEGTTGPPAQGGLFYTFKDNAFHGGSDRIELFQFTPNYANAGLSTFTTVATLPVAPYTYTVCGFFVLSCIPQPGTAARLDAVSEWPMQRFAFRAFSDHFALVGNWTVGGGSSTASGGAGAAIRWFELRSTGGPWTLFQEGTQDPGGGLDRFMGSISIDRDGNIALGYSRSSVTDFPSIRYATRTPNEPLGTLEPEVVMKAGGGSQTATGPGQRWGDYSAMSIDPVDGCTFWYTNEYYAVTSARNWSTAIGTFKVPNCPKPSNAFTIDKIKKNKKKGTATMTVTVPAPGVLALGGGGIKPQRPIAGRRAAAKTVGAGTTTLKIMAKGKKKKKLNKKGKVKVTATVTYTPTGGDPNAQTKNVKLKKKRKR